MSKIWTSPYFGHLQYLSQRRNDCGCEEGRCNVVDGIEDGPAKDEGDPVDVVAHLGDQFSEILQRFPLFGTGKFFGGQRYAHCVTVGPAIALK